MAKNSLPSDKQFILLQAKLAQELTWLKEQYETEDTTYRIRISRGNTLKRISKLIEKIAELGDPVQILTAERLCEQTNLALAKTESKKHACSEAIFSMLSMESVLKTPLNQEEYKQTLIRGFGKENMELLPPVPRDDFAKFVRGQTQRLRLPTGRFSEHSHPPPEEFFYGVRIQSLKKALEIHNKQREATLGIIRQEKDIGQELE